MPFCPTRVRTEKLDAVLRTISASGSINEEQLKVLQAMNLGKRSQHLASFAKGLKNGSVKLQSSKAMSGKMSGKLVGVRQWWDLRLSAPV
jgi:hypothetical protein